MPSIRAFGPRVFSILVACAAVFGAAPPASAQGTSASPTPRPWGRVSFFSTDARTESNGTSRGFGEFASSITYQLPDQEANGLEFGVDLRHSGYSGGQRPPRVALYEGFVGMRMADGAVRARFGQLWLNDLGALGSVAGGMVEYRQSADRAEYGPGRLRLGAFAGLEPLVSEIGYAPNVKKYGGFVSLEGAGARRHVLGFIALRDGSLTERTVLSTTNFLPMGSRVFVYQAAEYDLSAPAGQGRSGLAYLFANGRITPTDRLDVQATYSRGRSVDTRGLSEDVLSGRPITQAAIEGLLYESIGGRVTVHAGRGVRAYVGYSRDTTNREDAPTGRVGFGAFVSNLLKSGLDLTASDSMTAGPDRGLHSQYLSLGRQIGRSAYVYADYSTTLSVLRFSRSDGVTVDMRPHTRRVSGTATINLPASTSLMVTVDRTTGDQFSDLRMLAGVTYRFR